MAGHLPAAGGGGADDGRRSRRTFHRSIAFAASLIAGTAQVGWTLVQWLVMQRSFFLQPVMLAGGLLVLLLAWATHRGERLLPRTPMRPA